MLPELGQVWRRSARAARLVRLKKVAIMGALDHATRAWAGWLLSCASSFVRTSRSR